MIETLTRKDGPRYRVRVSGGPSKTFTRLKDAEKYEIDLKRSLANERAGIAPPKEAITFEGLVQLYIDNFAPSAWRLEMLKRARERWGKVMVRSIQPEAIGKWLHGLPLSGKTKAHILETLRQVFKAGVRWGYLNESPVAVGSFKAPSERRIVPIQPFDSWDQVLAVAAAVGELHTNAEALVRFVCSTGLTTPGEWREARWSDIDLAEREMMVHGTKTENRERTIPLSRTAIEALQLLPAPLRDDQRVFPAKRGGRFDYDQFRKDWKLALHSLGLAHRPPNEMRHTFATLALTSGVPIDDVASMLGHGDVAITYRYYRKWVRPMKSRTREILDTWKETNDEEQATADGR